MNKAVFLDRDGVVNVEVDYLSDPNQLVLIDGTKDAIKILKDNGYLVIIVTNQSGIARKYFTCHTLDEIHNRLNEMVDGMIDLFLFCPHLPSDNCICRKPNIGMFIAAKNYLNIDFEQSYMVGDKTTDIEAGNKAGIKTIAVQTGYGQTDHADYATENLLSAVEWIICKR